MNEPNGRNGPNGRHRHQHCPLCPLGPFGPLRPLIFAIVFVNPGQEAKSGEKKELKFVANA